ncbi:hypothetical protein [Herbaspirillum sp. LeCh32-8]|uniref:hypothetical protein n=1 Tax=Herbaspirillum sp. LeCh32-8 TaxID=2821356 RepID=UPI001AE7280B|nr:hypothetical protein [Herbaspirillum sp. LeCh32-8]
MSFLSSHQHAPAAHPASMPPLKFGFPRIYMAQVLQQKIVEQLYLGSEACVIGRHDAHGRFIALAPDDDFDGPAFTLRLSCAVAGHQVFDHDIDIVVGILFGRYLLETGGHRFDIPVLPTLDGSALTSAARRIVRALDPLARPR